MYAQSNPSVIAVGYSVRALVEACAHAGLESVAVDHFGDSDTRYYAKDRWIEFKITEQGRLSSDTRYALQAATTELLRAGKSVVFLLAGGMENLGGAVEQLREIASVLGPTEVQRRALRNIEFLYSIARAANLSTPQLRLGETRGSNWLWKPSASAGGLKIVRNARAGADRGSGYWQEYIRGEQIGVSCLLDHDGCRILGATSSFDAAEWLGPSEFIYRGSFGPIALSTDCHSQIECLCGHISTRTGYRGWLQFDFIRDERGALWLLECNPRWTAGMEIFLFISGANPVREILQSNNLSAWAPTRVQGGEFACFAKAVVYATHPINLTDKLIGKLEYVEELADRPHAPQLIECGHPIATVRAGMQCDHVSQMEDLNRVRLLDKLRQRADSVAELLRNSEPLSDYRPAFS